MTPVQQTDQTKIQMRLAVAQQLRFKEGFITVLGQS